MAVTFGDMVANLRSALVEEPVGLAIEVARPSTCLEVFDRPDIVPSSTRSDWWRIGACDPREGESGCCQ